MRMQDCPKFEKCNAPVCPLYHEHTTHLKGEPICFYLQEYVKHGGKARISGYIPREMVKALSDSLPGILSRRSDIKNRLARSAQSGSRIDALTKPRRAAA